MSYVFVSHASKDKAIRIKPLVEALVIEGVKLWVDRPGHGGSHLNFDQDFIERHHIQGLVAGKPWPDQISCAIREAGAVLVCLSDSLCAQREVLVQELLLGWHENKLVACIVDDLPYSKFPTDLGLPDLGRLQAERIDPILLRQAVDWLRNNANAKPDALPDDLRQQWEIVRKLVKDINVLLDQVGCRQPSPREVALARESLLEFPIGPLVSADEIPVEIIEIFAEHFAQQAKASSFFRLAMELLLRCNPENFSRRQIVVGTGEIPPNTVPPDEYWAAVLTKAGFKSRRTLACFMLAPFAPNKNTLGEEQWIVFERFLNWLKRP